MRICWGIWGSFPNSRNSICSSRLWIWLVCCHLCFSWPCGSRTRGWLEWSWQWRSAGIRKQSYLGFSKTMSWLLGARNLSGQAQYLPKWKNMARANDVKRVNKGCFCFIRLSEFWKFDQYHIPNDPARVIWLSPTTKALSQKNMNRMKTCGNLSKREISVGHLGHLKTFMQSTSPTIGTRWQIPLAWCSICLSSPSRSRWEA